MRHSTVLIIEENMNLAHLYEQELGDEGYDVLIAQSCGEAFECLAQTVIDVVIIEIGKSDRNRWAELEYFIGRTAIPLIINTGYPVHQDTYLSRIADAFIIKSSDISVLKRSIKDCCAIKNCCERYGLQNRSKRHLEMGGS